MDTLALSQFLAQLWSQHRYKSGQRIIVCYLQGPGGKSPMQNQTVFPKLHTWTLDLARD